MSKFYLYFYNEQGKIEKVLQARNEKHATEHLNLFRKFGYNVELKTR